MRSLVTDSSSIISLASSCLLWVLPKMNVNLIIPGEVFRESVERPQKIRRFMFESDRVNLLIKKGVIQIVSADKHLVNKIESLVNNLLFFKKHPLKIMHRGEIECLAVLIEQKRKHLLVDERTTRLLVENIDALKNYIQSRTGYHLRINQRVRSELEDMFYDTRVFRSSELVVYAYEKGLFREYGRNVLEHVLWAVKFGGCSITAQEIQEYTTLFAEMED